jgi:hypothetical protein
MMLSPTKSRKRGHVVELSGGRGVAAKALNPAVRSGRAERWTAVAIIDWYQASLSAA